MTTINAYLNKPFSVGLSASPDALTFVIPTATQWEVQLFSTVQWMYGGKDGADYITVPANVALVAEFVTGEYPIYVKSVSGTPTLNGLIGAIR
jgi:hypothetical protein